MIRDALALGATLYLPATRTDLAGTLAGSAAFGLRSAVICLEDAVLEADVPAALDRLAAFLRGRRDDAGPAVFVRPRDAGMLERIVRLPGVERISGFVLPKVTADTLPGYLSAPFSDAHRLMPTIETREAFDQNEMRRLRDQLLALGDRVLAVRIGGNDLLNEIGARRSRVRTIYEGPVGPLIARLVGEFAPWGFALTAPVMERYADAQLLREEVDRDLEHGLVAKTAIHPAQVPVIHAALAVGADELAEAEAVLDEGAPAVFGIGGAMAEPATHRRWAAATVRRAELFGLAEPLPIQRRG